MNQPTASAKFPTFHRMGSGLLRAGKWLLPRVLVLVLILAVINGIATLVLGRKVAARIAELKAKGEPVAFVDLGKPKVPDNENAAVFYIQAFKLLEGNSAKEDLVTLNTFLDAREREHNPKVWKDAEAASSRFRPMLSLIESAAARPKCQFPVKWEDGFAALFPHYAKMRDVSRILRATALIDARRGQTDQALYMVELNYRFSQSLSDDPILIGQLVHLAMLALANRSLSDVTSMVNISESQARKLSGLLSEIDTYPGFRKSMEGERAGGIGMFNDMMTKKLNLNTLTGADNSDTFTNLCDRLSQSPVSRPFVYYNELAYMDYMDGQIERSSMTSLDLKKTGYDDEKERDIPKLAILTRILTPVFGRISQQRDDGIAGVYGSRILLGLIAYKDHFGSYPNSLGELWTKLGWVVPNDPFSKKDFIYKREGNGFLLYSIGRDFHDDHGKTVEQRGTITDADHPYHAPGGRISADIIWQMNH